VFRTSLSAAGLLPLHFHGDMGERAEAAEQRLVIIRAAFLPPRHRYDRAEMAGTETPQMQVGQAVASRDRIASPVVGTAYASVESLSAMQSKPATSTDGHTRTRDAPSTGKIIGRAS
jgi:hypothetical protein